jgi:hypothetical protein
MLPWKDSFRAVITAFALLTAAPAAAQDASDLADAERALRNRRWQEAERIAEGLLEEGTRVGAELGPVYRVLGLARAERGDEDGAREALTRWLGVEPAGRLEGASDAVRSLWMEARGTWASSPLPLGATASLDEALAGLVVEVHDPVPMAARLRTRFRLPGGEWVSNVVPPAEAVRVAVPGLSGARRVEYSLALLDEFGNRVWLEGSDEAPLVLEAPALAVVPAPALPVPDAPREVPAADPVPFYAVGAALLAAGAGALVGAAVSHAERERLAGLYNGDGSGCTGSGATRGTLCGPERSALGTNEGAAIALYVLGGAAAVGGAALFLLVPGSTEEAAVACGPGPGDVGLGCGGRF